MINRHEDGEKQGLWSEEDALGTWVGCYEDGKKEGSWSFYEGCHLLKLVKYVNDVRDGLAYKFGLRGNLLLALEFVQDRIHGDVKFFSSDGQHIATYIYVYDKLDRVELRVLHDESPPKNATYIPEF